MANSCCAAFDFRIEIRIYLKFEKINSVSHHGDGNAELFVHLSSFYISVASRPPDTCVRAKMCFLFVCVFCILTIRPVRTVLVEAVLLLTIAGILQHVAVIKSKETGERESGKKNVCVVTLPKKILVVERKMGG